MKSLTGKVNCGRCEDKINAVYAYFDSGCSCHARSILFIFPREKLFPLCRKIQCSYIEKTELNIMFNCSSDEVFFLHKYRLALGMLDLH